MGFFPQGGLGIRANETEYSEKKLLTQSPCSAQISDGLGLLRPIDFFLSNNNPHIKYSFSNFTYTIYTKYILNEPLLTTKNHRLNMKISTYIEIQVQFASA